MITFVEIKELCENILSSNNDEICFLKQMDEFMQKFACNIR